MPSRPELSAHAAAQREALGKRLNRIEGQVRGIGRMLDEHLRHCVRDAAEASRSAGDEKVEEAVRAVERLLRV